MNNKTETMIHIAIERARQYGGEIKTYYPDVTTDELTEYIEMIAHRMSDRECEEWCLDESDPDPEYTAEEWQNELNDYWLQNREDCIYRASKLLKTE